MKSYMILMLLLMSSLAHAQKNFMAGYVIEINGDTIKGTVNDQEWAQNPKSIQFRNQSGNQATYEPHQITGFGISGRHYLSAITRVDKSPYKTNQVAKGISKESIVLDSVYLEVLVQGKLSLSILIDENGKKHYFSHNDSSMIQELILKQIFTNKDGKVYVAKIELYKNFLKDIMTDCPSIGASIDKVEYSNKTLINLFIKYNSCIGNQITYSVNKEKTSFLWNASGGLSLSKLDFKGGLGGTALTRADFVRSINPTAAIGFNMVLPKNRQRWSIYSELQFRSYQTEPAESVSANPYNFDFSYVKLNIGYRYTYPKGSIRPFLQGGISYAVAVKTETTLSDFRKDEQGLFAGVGLKKDRFLFETRYESTNAMSIYNSISSYVNSLYFLLSYQLN